MRDYQICVSADCVASNTLAETQYSLRQMRDILKADIRDSREIDLDRIAERRIPGSKASRKLLAAK